MIDVIDKLCGKNIKREEKVLKIKECSNIIVEQ